ncbi:GAF and ANTAR domain-containing protein [Alloalcanivorax gelatiniphagus]
MSVDDGALPGDGARRRVGQFTELSQALADAPNESARLQIAVNSAVALVETCAHAGVSINEHGGLMTRVSSDDTVRLANEWQNQLEQGPCLIRLRDQDTLVSRDLAHEERWPRWALRVHDELGVGSLLSLLIYTDRASFGELSLYAPQGQSFDLDDVAVGQALAAQLAVVMTAERQIDELGIALHSRLTIGQAQGVVMERLDMSAAQAFDYLRRVSSHTSASMIDVANDIATTRTLPDAGERPGT